MFSFFHSFFFWELETQLSSVEHCWFSISIVKMALSILLVPNNETLIVAAFNFLDFPTPTLHIKGAILHNTVFFSFPSLNCDHGFVLCFPVLWWLWMWVKICPFFWFFNSRFVWTISWLQIERLNVFPLSFNAFSLFLSLALILYVFVHALVALSEDSELGNGCSFY